MAYLQKGERKLVRAARLCGWPCSSASQTRPS